jgi:hypothetical protein
MVVLPFDFIFENADKNIGNRKIPPQKTIYDKKIVE